MLLLFTVGISVCKVKTFQHWEVFANRRGDEGKGEERREGEEINTIQHDSG